MGLFNFLKKANKETTVSKINETVDVPKDLFIDEKNPEVQDETYKLNGHAAGIDSIYNFLLNDFETRGYNDALTNPDESYKLDNINLIKQELLIIIQKVATFYEGKLRIIEFHISSRERAGLIDLVEELKTKKGIVIDRLKKIEEIRTDAMNGLGLTQRMILSYQRGFMRGLYALTQAQVLNEQI